ncbi:MAG: hypothetical protein ACIAXF_02545 [Phycisphaerales bacterium JB063]
MFRHPAEVRAIAEAYIGNRGRITGEPGSGTDGWVFSLEPHSVVKVHRVRRTYAKELEAYQRLDRENVIKIANCNVPVLRHFDEERLIIEMSFVTPPFVIDFGKCYFDDPMDFEEDRWFRWERKLEALYGSNAGWAMRVHRHLREKYGIYHDDVRPANIDLGPTPEEEADPLDEDLYF